MDRAIRDGYELHRAALAHGYNVTLLPRQVMEVESPDGGVKTTFTHGVPEATTLAAATYVQDIRMRRDMVSRAGYQIPSGATYAMGGRPASPFEYAGGKLGYPVVVKPAIGDNTIDVMTGITSDEELESAIDYLRIPPAERPGHVRAAYSLTELREPGELDGRPVVPDAYRFIIEDQVPGEYVRFLVLDGEVLHVMLCPDGPWKTEEGRLRDVTASVHSSLREIAAGVAAAVPGVALAVIDLVVPDHRAESQVRDVKVVEYAERPWLAVQNVLDPALGAELAAEILRHGVGESNTSQAAETVTVEFTLDGSVHPGNLVEALVAECNARDVVGEAQVSDPAMGHITGTMHGDPADIAWLMESMLDAGIDGQRAMLVEQRQVGPGHAVSFHRSSGVLNHVRLNET